ncbi:flagellar hook-associated protein FlgK [Reinekea marina]|uniref:Flagellar hook-associated protein 1 n=1 Tax=Reinekea marina TaxID=1310421 RepID=A0ABV7WT79_9GAMM|nr:flagellar hook-associated protein FlgK [Reinekea marina]MDN3649227.1 flagellar hook-associated protein FlgK [Reinekea marina]
MSILGTAITGLKAHQEALKTTGHNISNANTPGYSRQEVVMSSATPLYRGFGYVGQGVNVDTVRRIENQFLQGQLNSDTSAFNHLQTYREQIEQVDRILADDRTGLQPQLDRYFAALQGAADNPAYVPSRDVVLGEAQGLVDRFETISRYLADQESVVNSQIEAAVAQVNAIANGIAQLNEKIVTAQGSATSAPPNDLYDKREELVRQLAEFVDIDVIDVGATVNIAIGNGNPLVMKYEAAKLEAAPGLQDPFRVGIKFVSKVENVEITDSLNKGSIAGFLDFREEGLSTAINSLGRLAVAFTQETNKTHKLGVDLEGRFGNDFFQDLNDPSLTTRRVFAFGDNALPNDNLFNVYFKDSEQLTTSDYTFHVPGPENSRYEITRNDTGEVIKEGGLSNEYPQSFEFDGLELVLEAGTFSEGDSFTIAPLRDVAQQMELLIRQPSELALAYPIKANTSLSNQGSGLINQGAMLSRDSNAFAVDGKLSPPLLVQFESENRYSVLDNSDPGNPRPLRPPMENLMFVPGAVNTIFTDDPGQTMVNSWRARLPYQPTIGYGGPSTASLNNGINPERFTFYQTDPVTGKETALPTISTPGSASAKDIVQELNLVEGVEARAYTEVQLANFTNSGTPYDPDNPFEIWVNGKEITQTLTSLNQTTYMEGYPEEVPEEMGPNFLADRINHHYELQQMGIRAKSDGETLTIIDESGNDILVEMRGDKPQPVITGAPILPPGIPANVNAYIDPGDTFMLSTGEQWSVDVVQGDTQGKISNLTGYDFSSDGPYEFKMYLPDGRTGYVELTGNHETGEDVKAELAAKIQAQLDSPGYVKAEIDERGNLSYQIFMSVEGTGNNDVSRVNVGGQVDITMADGIRLKTDPTVGGIFNGTPEAKSTYMGFQFEISGRPVAGDEFAIGWNENGVSDNRNALDLVAIETTDTVNVEDGGMTLTESYSQTVEQIGTLTSQAQIRSDSAKAVLDKTTEELTDIKGVNLDEEAARLIEFQAAYNANAKVISIAQELFDSLLAAF